MKSVFRAILLIIEVLVIIGGGAILASIDSIPKWIVTPVWVITIIGALLVVLYELKCLRSVAVWVWSVRGWMLLTVIVLLFAVYIWPTRYRYWLQQGGTAPNRTMLIRMDRFTGELEYIRIAENDPNLPYGTWHQVPVF